MTGEGISNHIHRLLLIKILNRFHGYLQRRGQLLQQPVVDGFLLLQQ